MLCFQPLFLIKCTFHVLCNKCLPQDGAYETYISQSNNAGKWMTPSMNHTHKHTHTHTHHKLNILEGKKTMSASKIPFAYTLKLPP